MPGEKSTVEESVTSEKLEQAFAGAVLSRHAEHGDDTLTVRREAWRDVAPLPAR